MAGDELRQLSVQRRKAVDALARRAVELGAEHGYTAPDGAVQEVGQTLQTALGDPEIGDLVRAGRLTQAVTYGGFGPTDLASALGASIPAKPAQARAASRLRRRRPSWMRNSVEALSGRLPRLGSWRAKHGKPPSRRRRRPRPPRNALMILLIRSSHCAASCVRPKPASGRHARRREPHESTIKSYDRPRRPPSRRQQLRTRLWASELRALGRRIAGGATRQHHDGRVAAECQRRPTPDRSAPELPRPRMASRPELLQDGHRRSPCGTRWPGPARRCGHADWPPPAPTTPGRTAPRRDHQPQFRVRRNLDHFRRSGLCYQSAAAAGTSCGALASDEWRAGWRGLLAKINTRDPSCRRMLKSHGTRLSLGRQVHRAPAATPSPGGSSCTIAAKSACRAVESPDLSAPTARTAIARSRLVVWMVSSG